MSNVHWSISTIEGQLLDRNASLQEARHQLVFSTPVRLELSDRVFSPYFGRAQQGATLMPRPFWFVEPAGMQGADWVQLRTPTEQVKAAKEPWKGLAFRGRVEVQYVHATVIDVYPFLPGQLKLCVLPLVQSKRSARLQLADLDEIARRGTPEFAEWMRKTELVWQVRKKASHSQDTSAARYLNNHNNLVRQHPNRTRLVYAGAGSHIRAAVIVPEDYRRAAPISTAGFVLDQNLYEIYAELDEAHYLAAILNTDLANDAIKAVQTQGAFGARHIHRRPFEGLLASEWLAERMNRRDCRDLLPQCRCWRLRAR